jgi:hypothetical protein
MLKGGRHRAVPPDQLRAMPRQGAAAEGRACRPCCFLRLRPARRVQQPQSRKSRRGDVRLLAGSPQGIGC